MPYQEAQWAAGSKTPSRVSAQDTGVATSHGLPSDDWFLGEKSQANKEKQVTLLGTRKVPLKDILCVIPRVCFRAVVRSANPALPGYQQSDNEAEAEGLISQKSLFLPHSEPVPLSAARADHKGPGSFGANLPCWKTTCGRAPMLSITWPLSGWILSRKDTSSPNFLGLGTMYINPRLVTNHHDTFSRVVVS